MSHLFAIIKALPNIVYFGGNGSIKPDTPDDGVFFDCDTGVMYHREGGIWVSKMVQSFPIGATITNLNNVNPSAFLGYGTWVLRGRTNTPIVGPPPTILAQYIWERTA